MSKRLSFLVTLLLLSSFLILFAAPASQSIQETEMSTASRFLAPPSGRSDNGHPINLTESVNAFQSHTLNTTNAFSGPSWLVTQPNDSFGIQLPTNFRNARQNITFSNIVAQPEYMTVQDGPGTWPETSYENCTSQGMTSGFCQLAVNFSVPVRVNLTSVWLGYGAVEVSDYPPPIPLNVENDSLQLNATGNGFVHAPSGFVLGNGTLTNDMAPGWNEVQVRMSGGAPVTLEPKTTYWLVMNGSTIPLLNTGYYQWYYVYDSGGGFDKKGVACKVFPTDPYWFSEEDLVFPQENGINFLSVLFVRAVNASFKTMVYSSPAEVGMALNGTEVSGNTVNVDASKTSFQFTTNCSVNFVGNWTGRFEYFQPGAVSTHYIAESGFTLWNSSFSIGTKPSNAYTWYNLTFMVSPTPQYWSIASTPTNVTNTQGYSFNFASGSGYYAIRQMNDANSTVWNNDWLIKSQSTYWVSGRAASKVVAGLPLAINVTTAPLSTSFSHCNVTVYNDATGYSVYTKILAISSIPYLFQIRLNQSASYSMFLFDLWDSGNEVGLNETLVVTALAPLCNITLTERGSPVIGNTALLKFKFHNNSLGAGTVVIQPDFVSVNSTLTSNFDYDSDSGNVSVYINTASGRWHAGNISLVISAKAGVFNATLQTWFFVREPTTGFPFIMLVGTGVSGALMVVAVFLAIRRRRKGEEVRVKKELRLAESGSLAQLVVVEKAGGRNLWSRKIGTVKGVNPHLISGFLSANESILGVIFKSKEARAGLKFADYNYYKVIGEAGKHIMTALFCTERVGPEMRNALAEFTKRFERKYRDTLRSWNGDRDVFKDANRIFNEVFPLTTTSAYAIDDEKLKEVKLSRTAMEALHHAERLSAIRGFFFMPRIIEFLLTEKKKKRSAVMDILDELSRAGIFKQLTIEEAGEITRQRAKNHQARL